MGRRAWGLASGRLRRKRWSNLRGRCRGSKALRSICAGMQFGRCLCQEVRRLPGRDAQLRRVARGEFRLPDRTARAQERYRVCDIKNTKDLTNMKGSREILRGVPLGLSKSRE